MISQKAEDLFKPEQKTPDGRRSSEIRETYDQRLNHILTAATGVIAQVGYQKASMRSLVHGCAASCLRFFFSFCSDVSGAGAGPGFSGSLVVNPLGPRFLRNLRLPILNPFEELFRA